MRAGAAAVDISPPSLPVRRNGGFLEATASRITDPLFARALVLESGAERIALVVVDSCMVPRELCDEAKALAAAKTGIPPARVLIAATHTHSAPSVMDFCLGSRADPAYTKFLPGRIAAAIVAADARRVPAELGVTVADAPEQTHSRRWIRRLDRTGTDPFGGRTVLAMMHPGYENPDYVGPAGPVDAGLTIVSVRALDGRPLALLANYSMHYFGAGGGLSPDYCGLFARRVAERLAPGDERFVPILSQGTSGDQHWMDYGRPRRALDIEAYTAGLVKIALAAYSTIRYRRDVVLAMEERRLALRRRRPDAARLEWAKKTLPDRTRRPRNRPEVYAEQAFYLDEHPSVEIVLQAVRIGELGVAAIPCEVFGLTGLEFKARSPLQPTFTMELANGAAGYIPPPEQHALGGYTTWPARTAGLEVEAEPKIVGALLDLLERVGGEKRREPRIVHGRYPATILADRPLAYWRLEELRGPLVHDARPAAAPQPRAAGSKRAARVTPPAAFHLRGPASRAFSLDRVNRCLHLAGGRLELPELPLGERFSVELWFWSGVPAAARETIGTLLGCGADRVRLVRASDGTAVLEIGKRRGETALASKTWHHMVLTREGERVRLYLDGKPEVDARLPGASRPARLTIGSGDTGGGGASEPPLEGKVDEVAVFDRVLSPSDVARHFAAAELPPPPPARQRTGILTRPSSAADRERIAAAILRSKPLAFWPLVGPRGAADRSGHGTDGELEPGAAPAAPDTSVANFTGGRMKAAVGELGDRYSVELWFFNELPNTARPVTGYFFSRGAEGAHGAPGDHVGIGGTHSFTGRLIVFNGNRLGQVLGGTRVVSPRTWNHVVFTRDGKRITVHLNGRREVEIAGELTPSYPRAGPTTVFFGGRNDRFAPFQGRLEEVAVYGRPLTAEEARVHFLAAGVEPPQEATPDEATPRAPRAPPPPTPPPRSPEETVRSARIRRGFRVELVAAEPLVLDPVAIDWDARGRLWVVEMADYPYGMDGAGKPGGRVRVLEDGDGDGRYDRSTVFADGLSFPTGVLAWGRGALVTAAPDIVYVEDTDGDGRADRREVLYTGFLLGNQQLRVNGLRYGLDNWIHCANGGHHPGYGAGRRVRAVKTGIEIVLGSRDLRIRPDQGRIEPESGPTQFGRVRNDWGDWFGVQNSRPLWHWVLPDRYARRNPHLPAPEARLQLLGVSPTLWPAKTPQKRYHSFADATRFTAACGPSIYRDDLLFGPGDVTHAFTCDSFHGIVQHAVFTREGVSFAATVDRREGEFDFFAATDRWCRPVMTRTGPDGALWIVDMYRYMIEHPDWLPAVGKEELRPFYRSGDDRGRIYRVLPVGKAPRRVPVLANETSAALVERLESSNGPLRDLAQRLLIERRDAAVVPALERKALHGRRPQARAHAVATLDGMRALAARVVLAVLRDPDPRVVRHAVRLAEPLEEATGMVAAMAPLVESPDAALRLQLAHSLGQWRDARAGRALGRLAVRDHGDPWIRAAILSSAVGHQRAIARAVAADAGGSLREFAAPLLRLALATNEREVVVALLAPLVAPAPQELEAWRIEALADFLDGLAAARVSLQALAVAAGTGTGHAARSAATSAGGGTGGGRLAPLVERVERILAAAAGIVEARDRPEELRAAAVRLLGREPQQRDRDRRFLGEILGSAAPSVVQLAAVERLARLGGAPDVLLSRWRHCTPAVRAAVVRVVLARTKWVDALLDAVEGGDVAVTTIAPTERQQLTTVRDGTRAARARRLFAGGVVRERRELLAALRPALGLTGAAARGREIFAQVCGRCHAVGGVGTEVGPDLRAVTDRSGAALLESIVDPNAVVDPRYLAYAAVLRTGEIVSGLIVAETGNSLIFLRADGTRRTVLRGAIRSLESEDVSFMPEGLEADLSLRDAADIIAFLQDG